MPGCSKRYYKQMDESSMMRIKALGAKLNNAGRESLKNDQRRWLSERNKTIQKIDCELE